MVWLWHRGRIWVAGWALAIAFYGVPGSGAEPELKVQILKTAGGVRFGILGDKPEKPAPTLIVLASSPEETLGSSYFLQSGFFLAKQGWLCVSVDLPCHGQDVVAGQPGGIDGWRHRLDAGQDLFGPLQKRSTEMLDYLVEMKFTDPDRIAACGTSRGGFSAVQIAAKDHRIRSVVAMAPVTDLLKLREFANMKHPDRATLLSLENQVANLVKTDVWLVIGDRDDRVSTDAAVQFMRKLSGAVVAQKLPTRVDLWVPTEARGHTTPPGSAEMAATWLTQQLKEARPR